MLTALIYLAAGFALLYFGGEGLVKGAAGLALRFGLTPLAVGLTVVAFGTSCPELAVSMLAARKELGDIAVGNAVGSNIANVGLILGLASLIRPLAVHRQLMRFDLPVLLVVSVGFLAMAWNSSLGRIEGGLLVVLLIVYNIVVVRLARRETPEQREVNQETIEELPASDVAWPLQVAYVIAGVAMLVLGGQAFVEGATELARSLNVSEAIISLTVVAFGTSLPELSACLVAVARGHGDMAVGNVIGSNLFNILSIMGLTGLVFPIEFPEIQTSDLLMMLAITVAMAPLFARRMRLGRLEGGLLLLAYAGYVTWLALGEMRTGT